VNWVTGRTARKRSKTADHANVPTVEYPLWPRTFELLREYRSGRERVLQTEKGNPWVRTELKDGRLVKADNIAAVYAWQKTARFKGFAKPLKLVRKTAASLLDSHPEYGRYAELFLGHAPKTVAGRHYVRPSQERFDEAVMWLVQFQADSCARGSRCSQP
jgi:hypothetical protein